MSLFRSVVSVQCFTLTGSGAASAIKSAPTHLGNNVWRFNVSNLVTGAVNITLAPDANDIEDGAGNDLATFNWTFNVNIPIPQQPPVLATIGDQTINNQAPVVIELSATDANNDPLTYSVSGQSLAYALDQSLGLGHSGSDHLNWGGRNEKWMTGSGGKWYYITPDGRLYRWLGSTNLANDPLVETLSSAYWTNTSLLYQAQANNPPATLSLNGSTLTITPNVGFVGKFYITVGVTDGQGGSDNETFLVHVV